MLRKTKELKGARLAARDGEIGHLKDFYFDDQSWTVRYLVAYTGEWLPNRQVLLSPFAVASIECQSHKVVKVDLTRQQIEESPSIEEHKPITRQYESQYLSIMAGLTIGRGHCFGDLSRLPGLTSRQLCRRICTQSLLRGQQKIPTYAASTISAVFLAIRFKLWIRSSGMLSSSSSTRQTGRFAI